MWTAAFAAQEQMFRLGPPTPRRPPPAAMSGPSPCDHPDLRPPVLNQAHGGPEVPQLLLEVLVAPAEVLYAKDLSRGLGHRPGDDGSRARTDVCRGDRSAAQLLGNHDDGRVLPGDANLRAETHAIVGAAEADLWGSGGTVPCGVDGRQPARGVQRDRVYGRADARLPAAASW